MAGHKAETDWKEAGSRVSRRSEADGPKVERMCSTKSTKSNQSVFAAVTRHQATSISASKSTLAGLESQSVNASDRPKSWCCCGFLRRPRSAPEQLEFRPTVVLLRHSERLDYVDKNYKETEEGKEFPHDAPLTQPGWKMAEEAADDLAKLHNEGLMFAAVATSPYRRCVETAAVIAKRLNVPIVLDQEIGEVWEKKMGDKPWRSPSELKKLLNDLMVPKVLNPLLGDGGYKLFGKVPQYPETLEKARNRMVVRFETYIRQSEELEHNFILCTHADGMAAACGMFERGCADVTRMDFCSRIIARRIPQGKDASEDMNTFAKRWDVELKGIEIENKGEGATEKMNEYIHSMACEENEQMVVSRREKRTSTDKTFDAKMKSLFAAMPESEDLDTTTPDTKASEQDTSDPADRGSIGTREVLSARSSMGDLATEPPLPAIEDSSPPSPTRI